MDESSSRNMRKSPIAKIFRNDPDYPELLKTISDPPPVLYVRGEFKSGLNAIAFVGSRRPTPYGRRMARELAGSAAARGLVVVSGMARGIDTEAHQAALQAQGRTWAVWGSGLDCVYPPENAALADQIVAAGGCCISEFPPGTRPIASNFPRRNRIVSGLSWGTVVVEGEIHSGSLITARLAAEQGRQVFAVPGPADSSLSDAPHLLIKEGAKLVKSIMDIVEELPPGCQGKAAPEAKPRQNDKGLAEPHQKILKLLGGSVCSLDELSRGIGLEPARLSRLLFEMELEDLVVPVAGQRYAKK